MIEEHWVPSQGDERAPSSQIRDNVGIKTDVSYELELAE